jgi:uroporphyrinogen III methyltransferase/synthase
MVSYSAANTRPSALEGRKIVITRAREQSSNVLAQLAEFGAQALEFPVIKIVPPENWQEMDQAIAELSAFTWVVFTSVNGVEYFWQRMEAAGKNATAFNGVKVCAIGPATAASLEIRGLTPQMVPPRFVAESILEELDLDLTGQSFLLPRADIARENLVKEVQNRGGSVTQITAYRTVVADNETATGISSTELVSLLEAGEVDMVTFTSSSTVRNFAKRLATTSDKPLPQLLGNTAVACIGPITAGTARQYGLTINLEASEFTMDKLVEDIILYFSKE